MRRFGNKTRGTAIAALGLLLAAAGCGGGGGGTTAAGSGASNAPPSTRVMVEAPVGPAGAVLAASGVRLTVSLPATQTISISERVYPGGPPEGVVGRVVDIKPDGTVFPRGATLCLSYAGYPGDPSELGVFTGERLNEALPSVRNTADKTLCATLAHASPYSITRVAYLTLPGVSLFNNMDSKKNPATVKTTSGTDPNRGPYTEYDIYVDCKYACIESGRRRFRVITSGPSRGDLLINESEAAYPVWTDLRQLYWVKQFNNSGVAEGGIAYYLAGKFVGYYASNALNSNLDALDATNIRVTRFFYAPNGVTVDYFADLVRDETEKPGIITLNAKDGYGHDWSFAINRSTLAVTRAPGFLGSPAAVTLKPGDSGYQTFVDDALMFLYMLLGLDDTPDGSLGNAHDDYYRMSPNQELFTVNVMNLLKGYGWNSARAIEAYYRDRLYCLSSECRTTNK